MARSGIDWRKQRTRAHVIEALSINYVERFILESGHAAQAMHPDYSYDLLMRTFDERGMVEPGHAYWQLKASETWVASGDGIAYDVDIRDHNLWRMEPMPVILALYDAGRKRAWWLHLQGWFGADPARLPRRGAKTVRVRVPLKQTVSRRALASIRAIKEDARAGILRILR
ncbi:MAG: DUF4365 domain-containing protein [Gemmataceae bacterium]|nr:DUF4365 domain-containing protein [Gemmataceae bacterium]